MCGIVGVFDPTDQHPAPESTLQRMASTLRHRGPDSDGFFTDGSLGFGFRRLSIIDLDTGDQPLFNEDGSVVLICNGEIFNYRELRRELESGGHRFATNTDAEVLVHLYEDHGEELLDRLNGQFAFAIFDRRRRRLFLARDHLGIAPLYYTVRDGVLIFASEIKAILEHPRVPRRVDPRGLDQVLTFPGLISPTTMFDGIRRLSNGHFLTVDRGGVREHEYWDLVYPREDEVAYDQPDEWYVERLRELFLRSVRYRLQADVPVGFYLSGGLDSSLVGAAIHLLGPEVHHHAFSISFADEDADEAGFQKMMADQLNCTLHENRFDGSRTADMIRDMVYHAECPVKETYNTCSMALSRSARDQGIKVILTGEGADELFAGYVGYRFDQARVRQRGGEPDLDQILEEELRERLWGDPNLLYEHEYHAFNEQRRGLYSQHLRERFPSFNCAGERFLNLDRLDGRSLLHKRSYLDYRLRMVDHLLMDHGDQMALANSVEARFPFLDIDFVEFATRIPPHLKLNGYTEKYILRKMLEDQLPTAIAEREKFGWFAPSSADMLQQGVEWIHDVLSYDRIRRQGFFDPDVIEGLKKRYSEPGFRLKQPFETDLLIIIATFGLFLDVFDVEDAAVGEEARAVVGSP